jgi:inorganic triphosphatase YgiF
VREDLQATYHDTDDRALARAAVALRVRREGSRWVQAAKAPGADAMSRLEHEADLGAVDMPSAPAPDLARHVAHPALHDRLVQALADAAGPLRAQYGTVIRRTRRVVRHQGARIELALDEGEIVGGGASLPVAELEFELLDGSPAALLDLAQRWVVRHGLWLDVRSKAQRGDQLARGLSQGPARKAARVVLDPAMPPAVALGLGVHDALGQVAANAAELADAIGPRPDCVHQLRVGLRRLRVLLQVFGSAWEGLPVDVPALRIGAADTFRRFGGRRDHDVVAALLAAPLQAAGYGRLPLPVDADEVEAIAMWLRGPAFNCWLLQALAAGVQASAPPPRPLPETASGGADAARPALNEEGPSLRSVAAKALRRRFKRLQRDAAAFGGMAPAEQHGVRKRAKALRYALEFAGTLFPARRLRRFQRRLEAVQEVLGAYTDVLTGSDLLGQGDASDAATAFARGWLAGRREVALAACKRPLKRLAAAEPPWG